MAYKDIRISSFNLSPQELNSLYEKRINDDATIKLDFKVNKYQSFVVVNSELLKIISKVYQIDKKLSLLSNDLPGNALDNFVVNSMIDEIQQSNEVENVQSTKKEIKDAYQAVNKGNLKKRFASMVKKYLVLESDENIPLSSCQDIRNLYDEFILDEVLREDPNDKPDGDYFRKEKVNVKNSHNEIIHEGLYPESNIIITMNSALSILNNDDYDILIRVALFHYFFGYIHPFYNGNGRMDRFISSYMFSKFFSKAACFRISYVIKQNRNKYYELFKNANDKRNRGELTEFVMGYLSFFKEALEETYNTLEQKQMLYHEYEGILDKWFKDRKLSVSQKVFFRILLQSKLFGDSNIDISDAANIMECSQKTARKILSESGSLVYFTKAGRKQIWHLDLNHLSSLGVE